MHIVIATPLYPPDIAEPAPYVKELARRLKYEKHQVTIVLFGHLPEQVPGVKFITINKRDFLPVRLFNYFQALWRATAQADIVYTLNGPSVELTASLVTFLRRTPMLIHLGDHDSNEWVAKKPILRAIKWLALKRAAKHISTLPPQRPEILPFKEQSLSVSVEYDASWNKHINNLISLINVVTKRK